MPHSIGVGDGSGFSIYGNETNWPTSIRQKEIEVDSSVVEEVPVSHETSPFQIDFSKEKGVDFFKSGAWVSMGVFIAENLAPGKAWILPARQSERRLMLVNKQDWDSSVTLFMEELNNAKSDANKSIWPEQHLDLIEDPNIGPMMSVLGNPTPDIGEKVLDG